MSFQFVQNRTNNHLTWVMVDSADFASRESAVSATTKIKIYGTLETATGVNFITSGTGSLTNDIVHVGVSATGVYHIALAKADLSDASAAWYDEYIVILSATGAAYETFIVEGVRTDTSAISNLLSNLSAIASDIYSALTLIQGASYLSDMASAVWTTPVGARVDSRLLLVQSRLSDLDSRLVSDVSDILSAIAAGGGTVTVSNISDIASAVWGFSARGLTTSLVTSSDLVSKVWAHATASDILSTVKQASSRVTLVQSRLSDLDSRLMSDVSDILSAIAAGGGTLTVSNISDIASAVWGVHWTGNSLASSFGSAFEKLLSHASDAMSAAQQGNSRALLVQSRLSDLDSRLMSDISDILSAIAAGGGTLTVSNISDIASAVWGLHWTGHSVASSFGSAFERLLSNTSDAMSAAQQGNSRILLVQSRLSDLDSRLVSDVSDIRSAIAAIPLTTLTVSDISDVASAVWANAVGARVDSRLLLTQSMASDAASAAQQGNSRVLVVQSRLSDLDSRLVSDVSDIRSAIATTPSAVWATALATKLVQLNPSDLSDLRSAITGVVATLSVSDISDIASAVWATPLATKLVQLNPSDLSDLRSAITGVVATLSVSDISDIASAVRATLVSDLSDILSAAVQTNSRVLVVQSRLSDLDSRLVSDVSDLRSAIATTPSAVWATALATKLVQLNPSDLSDLRSAITGVTATLSVSDISDIASAVWATPLATKLVQLNPSDLSDLRSAITGVVATLSVSDISDIASAVRATLVSDLSDILSAAVQTNSRVLLVQSRLSDLDSRLVSDVSDIRSAIATTPSAVWATALATKLVQLNPSDLSDLRSAIAGVTAAVSASDMSDIASRVWATAIGTRVDSRIALLQSTASDAASGVSDLRSLLTTTGILLDASTMSDLRSAITAGGGAVTVSNISDIASAVWAFHWTGNSLASSFGSAFEKLLSGASDAASAAQQANSRIALVQGASYLSDIASQVWAHTIGARVDSRIVLLQSTASDAASGVSDLRSLLTTTGILLDASTMSDIRSAITAGGGAVTVSNMSDIASAVWAFHWTGNSLASSFGSAFEKLLSGASDAASAAQQGNSRILLVQSRLSDLDSRLMSDVSDILSAIAVGGGTVTVSNISDIASAVWATPLATKLVQLNTSDLSDLRSAITAGPAGVLTVSDISDIASAVWATPLATKLVQLNPSDLSDLRSAITGVTAAVSASDMSDIASRVWATVIGTRVDSRIALIQSTASDAASGVSDLRSLLTTTGILLDASTMSDLRSAITAGGGAVTVSNISDIASAVWGFHWTGNSLASSFGSAFEKLLSGASDAASAAQQANSRVLLVQSRLSDLDSRLVSDVSDLRSAIATTPSAVWATALATKLVQLNPSDLSDLRSAMAAGGGGALTTSDISDIASAVWATPLATKLVQLNSSDLSDLRSAIAGVATTLSVSDISDIASAVRAIVASDLSDILSGVRQTNSRTLLVESDTSNIYSLLTAGVALDASTMSDLRSAIGGVTFTLGASELSDIASAVRTVVSSDLSDILSSARQGASRTLAVQGDTANIYSLLSDVGSDVQGMAGTVGTVYGLLSSLESDIQSRFPATIPELTGDPGATPTWVNQAALQYMWLKNSSKTTVSKRFLRAASGQVVLSAALADDSGSFVQGVLAE